MGFHSKEQIKIIVLFFIIYGLGSVFADSLEGENESQANSQPKDNIPVGKPLISLSKIYSLNESKTQDEDGKGVNSTFIQKTENISSTLLKDLFSFIDDYPDYMQQREDFEDFAEEDEEPLDKNQNIQPPNAPPTISLREDCPRDLSVRVGHTSGSDAGIIVDVLSSRMHEGYNGRDVTKNDIGLIKLEKPLNFTDKIMPVCLHTRNNYANVGAIVTGWGRVSETGKYSDVLKEAAVKVYEWNVCRRISHYAKKDIHAGILCARRKRIDACQGDSGGPLVFFEPSIQRFVIIGITSYGIGCARFRKSKK
ncbi:Trypsin epsilon [Armadillidium nasatum]|uniref:Trypsin epsilon n=1 Tax=Armadillidium nasatum TaxID=96803 RepID=A0A5N5TP06_9CRUS|nr:Trypsin epsilon [Armadillidium nasatum]